MADEALKFLLDNNFAGLPDELDKETGVLNARVIEVSASTPMR